jgi:hypothetical protein
VAAIVVGVKGLQAQGVSKPTRKQAVRAAAANTTGEVLPKHTHPDGQISHQKQADRASANGVSRRTQRKLDRLARDFPFVPVRANVPATTLASHSRRALPCEPPASPPSPWPWPR